VLPLPPPHITPKQAQAFTSTLWSGDPEQRSMIVQTATELMADLLPGQR
jgi:pyruvate dehydrogenase (quinone)